MSTENSDSPLNDGSEEAEASLFSKPNLKVIALAIATFLLVALASQTSFWAFHQLESSAAARLHTHTVLHAGDLVLSKLKDAETGQRGYVLTGNEAFLQPYVAVADTVQADFRQLRQATLIPAAQQHLDKLSPLIDAKMAELREVIKLQREHRKAEAINLINTGEGKHLMDAIRSELQAFNQIEAAALAQVDAEFQKNMRNLLVVLSATSAFTLLSAFMFGYFIYRQDQQRLKDAVHAKTQQSLASQEAINSQLLEAHDALQVSQEKLAVTLRSIGDGVIATDNQGRVTLLNLVAEQLTGWTQAEAAGLLVDDIFHIINQYSRDPVPIPIKDALAHGTIQGMANHTVLIARDGTELAIADSCAPIRDDGEQVIGAVLVFRDVTAEYALQANVHESESRLNFALQMTHTGGWELNLLDGSTRRTLEHDRIFGYQELLPAWTYEMFMAQVLPAERMGVDNCFQASVGQQTDLNFECRIRRMDGEERWVWVSGEHQFDAQGRATSMAGIVQDITARKQVELALKQLHERAQLALDAGKLGDWRWDAATDEMDLSVQAANLFGFPAGRTVTRAQLRERLSAEDAERASGLWDEALRSHTDYHNQYPLQHPLLGPRWLEMTGRGNYAADGSVSGMNGVVQDIHERKLAESTKLRLAAIVESSEDAIISKDLQGTITSWNEGAEKMFGYTADEIIGKPITVLMPTPRQAEQSRILGEITRGINVKHFETVRRRKDGSCLDVSITVSAIKDDSGKIVGASKVARDITERKFMELQLHEAVVTAEKANQAKSEFLSSMSHELRTPLNAILGFAQLLEVSDPPPTAAQTQRLHEIIKAGWYLLELINEVLDLALIESGKLSLSAEPVLLKEVMHECQAMIETMAEQHGIQLIFKPVDETWAIYADRTRVKQVLINLLSNAIKYNRQHGTVEIKSSLNPPHRIRITVKDSGMGLSPEHLAQLFQPFNRLGQEHGNQEGTGIGLVVTKKLVQLMGGDIGVNSTVGVGSEFWVDLIQDTSPLGLTGLPAPALRDADDKPPQGTLLYVEDNPANLMLVEQIIAEYSPLRMLSARDANLGIELARTHLPDIILMDINLPGISGFKALKILRDDPATANIPVIALSANAMPRDVEKGLAAGFFQYLTKPIKVMELMDALKAALKLPEVPSAKEQ